MKNKKEAEANYFAMMLLMPDFLLEKEIARLGGISIDDDEKLKSLSKTFQVPMITVALRLGVYFKEKQLADY